MEKGIVQPIVNSRTPRLGSLGVLSAARSDLHPLLTALRLESTHPRSLYMSQLYFRDNGIFLAGPFMGAPSAVMILETLAAWGGKQFIFLGWCGAISPEVEIGDILVPTQAWIDEGTSLSYLSHPADRSQPSSSLTNRILNLFKERGLSICNGDIWTTDAIFRETPDKVRHYRHKGALAVEMELSALFAAASYLKIEITGVLVVSDDLSNFTWKAGFKEKRFIENRRKVTEAIAGLGLLHPGS